MSIINKVILATASAFVLLFVVLWVIMSSSINRQFVDSEAFRATVEYVYNDSVTHQRIGKIIKVDSSVSGYLTPYKSARLVFDVYTTKEEVTVKCRLKYEQDQWLIEEIEYH